MYYLQLVTGHFGRSQARLSLSTVEYERHRLRLLAKEMRSRFHISIFVVGNNLTGGQRVEERFVLGDDNLNPSGAFLQDGYQDLLVHESTDGLHRCGRHCSLEDVGQHLLLRHRQFSSTKGMLED